MPRPRDSAREHVPPAVSIVTHYMHRPRAASRHLFRRGPGSHEHRMNGWTDDSNCQAVYHTRTHTGIIAVGSARGRARGWGRLGEAGGRCPGCRPPRARHGCGRQSDAGCRTRRPQARRAQVLCLCAAWTARQAPVRCSLQARAFCHVGCELTRAARATESGPERGAVAIAPFAVKVSATPATAPQVSVARCPRRPRALPCGLDRAPDPLRWQCSTTTSTQAESSTGTVQDGRLRARRAKAGAGSGRLSTRPEGRRRQRRHQNSARPLRGGARARWPLRSLIPISFRMRPARRRVACRRVVRSPHSR